MEAVCRKRGLGQLLSGAEPNTSHQTASVSTSGSVSTSLGSPALNQLGSPGLQPAKQQKQHHLGEQQQVAAQSFPVLEYHMQQQGEAGPGLSLDAQQPGPMGQQDSSNSAVSSIHLPACTQNARALAVPAPARTWLNDALAAQPCNSIHRALHPDARLASTSALTLSVPNCRKGSPCMPTAPAVFPPSLPLYVSVPHFLQVLS